MHVTSTNLLRFASLGIEGVRRTEARPAAESVAATPADSAVAFPAKDDDLAGAARTHGMLVSATRIAERVSDQLEHVEDL